MNRLTNARAEIQAARDALRVADAAADLGILRDALSRAYYAAFHAVRAMLLLEGIETKTHSGLLQMFNDHVVRAGKLEPRYNLVVTRLQSYRLASDYAYVFIVDGPDVRAEIEAARDLVARAADLVDGAPTEPV